VIEDLRGFTVNELVATSSTGAFELRGKDRAELVRARRRRYARELSELRRLLDTAEVVGRQGGEPDQLRHLIERHLAEARAILAETAGI
jgi:hypothetical protein